MRSLLNVAYSRAGRLSKITNNNYPVNHLKILWKTLFKAITFQGLCRLLRGELLVIVFLYDIRIQVLFI